MEILDNNNLDLQKLMQEIQALPQAKNWGGGSTDIVATELSQDLVIPAYTDTQLTVKKVEKGLKADFGTVNFPTNSNLLITFTIEHGLGVVPKSFYLFPNGYIYNPKDENHAKWGGVAISNNKVFGTSTHSAYSGDITVYERTITLEKTEKYIKIMIPEGPYNVPESFYFGDFAWLAIA